MAAGRGRLLRIDPVWNDLVYRATLESRCELRLGRFRGARWDRGDVRLEQARAGRALIFRPGNAPLQRRGIAVGIARRLVGRRGVKRTKAIGPHLAAVVAA